MGAYFGTTEITNFDCLVPVNGVDITQVFFATNEIFTVWGEYDGTLPAQYRANGSMLVDYRIYGASGGVGDRTQNSWDRGVPEYNYAKDYKKYNPNNAIVLEAGTYTISSDDKLPVIQAFDANYEQYKAEDAITHTAEYVNTWDDMALTPKTGSVRAATIILSFDCILTFSVLNSQGTYLMITSGSTAPSEYVPYGYGLSLSVTSPKSYTCEVDSLQASTNYAKIAVAELPTAKVGDKITVTVGGTDYSLPVKNVDNSYVYIENMEV